MEIQKQSYRSYFLNIYFHNILKQPQEMIILLNQRNINIKYLKAVGIDSMCTYLLIELIVF